MSGQQNTLIKEIKREKRGIGCYEFVYNSLESTMILAKELAEKNYPDGTIVIAEEQTQGMGRNGRVWFSPKGGLWLSVLLRPKIDTSYMFIFSYLTSLSVAEAIKKIGITPKIKWPNDILIENKKVAGILIDSKITDTEIEYVIAGIGINVNNDIPKLPDNAIEGTTIKEQLGRKIEVKLVKRYLYDTLEKNYSTLSKSEDYYIEILKKWDYFNFLKDRTVSIYDEKISSPRIGKVIGINFDKGSLIVEVNSKRFEIFDSSTIRI